jgi:hypothetical protein
MICVEGIEFEAGIKRVIVYGVEVSDPSVSMTGDALTADTSTIRRTSDTKKKKKPL